MDWLADNPMLVAYSATTLAFLLLGGWMLFRGFRGRRVGDGVFCRRCGYNLAGAASARCSECGADLTERRAKVFGQRWRILWRVVLGCVLMLGAGLAATSGGAHIAKSLRWYDYAPTFLLFNDIASGNLKTAESALDEFDARFRRGQLSDAQQRKLIAVLLERTKTSSAATRMFEFCAMSLLAALERTPLMAEAQRTAFFESLVEFALSARSPVAAEGAVPIELAVSDRGSTEYLAVDWEVVRAEFDDQPLRVERRPPLRSNPYFGPARVPLIAPAGAPGEKSVRCRVKVSAYRLPPRDQSGGSQVIRPAAYSFERDLVANVSVREAGDIPAVGLVRGGHTPADLQRCIIICQWFPGSAKPSDRNTVSLIVEAPYLPIPVAFDVIVRTGSTEQRLATFVHRATPSSAIVFYDQTSIQLTLAEPLEKADIILRSNPNVATQTTDIFQIWDGELIYPDFKFRSPPVADDSSAIDGSP